jgi:hypothetical protein
MYFGITKMYDRKTVGPEFTKPVQIVGTTQFFPQEVVFHRSSHFCRRVSVQTEIKLFAH